MPIYEYICEKGHTFEAMQRMADDPLTECEVCGRPVRRVLHPVAVHFKGSGFYNTDYGTRKRQREKAAESSSKSDSTGSSDGATSSTSKDSAGSSSSTDGAKSDKATGKSKAAAKK
jgi:putative FmdB family regulatory protein